MLTVDYNLILDFLQLEVENSTKISAWLLYYDPLFNGKCMSYSQAGESLCFVNLGQKSGIYITFLLCQQNVMSLRQ